MIPRKHSNVANSEPSNYSINIVDSVQNKA
jgi:hypothetical protein